MLCFPYRRPSGLAECLRGISDILKLIGAADATWLLDQPCKTLRLHRNEQGDHEAEGQAHNRASGYSAPEHFLFAVSHFTPPFGLRGACFHAAARIAATSQIVARSRASGLFKTAVPGNPYDYGGLP